MRMIKEEYWKDVTFNKSEVKVDYKECNDVEFPYKDYKDIHKVETNFLVII